MIRILKRSAYLHGYLFITAAWLYTLSFLFTNYFSYDANADKVAKTLSAYLETQQARFNTFVSDSAFVASLTAAAVTPPHTQLYEEGMPGVFVYEINDIGNLVQVYWNTNRMAVQEKDFYRRDGHYVVEYPNGYFELVRKTVRSNGRQYVFFGLIPVYWNYSIEDEVVQSRFAEYEQLSKNYTINSKGNGSPVLDADGRSMFYIEQKNYTSVDQPGTVSVMLRVAAIILLMIFVNALAADLAALHGFFSGFLFLFVVVVSFRTLTYLIPFPFNYHDLGLFNSLVYASSMLHPSLGDLLINAILLFWLVSFIKFNFFNVQQHNGPVRQRKVRTVAAVAALFFLPLFTFSMSNFLSSLVRNSAVISFDVTNFFSLNVYTVVSFVIICILLLSFFYASQILVRVSAELRIGLYWRLIILLSFSFLFVSFKLAVQNDVIMNFSLILWMLLFYLFTNLRNNELKLSFYNSVWFMPWSIFLMASVTALLIFQNKTLEQEKRKSIAENLDMVSDVAKEKILNMAVSRFSGFFLRDNFRNFFNETDNALFKNSIITNNLGGYLKNFDTRVYTYDYNKQPLFNDDSTSWEVLRSILVNKGVPTNIPGLSYYENSEGRVNFIYEKDIYTEDSLQLGYAFLLIRPRQNNETEPAGQMFRSLFDKQYITGSSYDHAIYKNNRLIESTNNYAFTDTLPVQKRNRLNEFSYVEKNGYSELWYYPTSDRVIIVVRENNWFAEAVTFFAYLFGIFIVLVLLQHFGFLILETHFRMHEIKKVFRFNFRTQIQVIIVTVSIISFIVIGIATISFFINRFEKNNEDTLRNASSIIVNEIESLVKNGVLAQGFTNNGDESRRLELQRLINEISQIHRNDINLYDVSGKLQVSSQQFLYDNGVFSDRMNPVAYDQMHYFRRTQYIQTEQMVTLEYLNIYLPIRNEYGSTVAYINVPYINSAKDLNQEISTFLITLINLNALIFIIAGAIAIWITTRITSSFTLIGDKMKAISFGAANEEIEWKRNDELGELVSEYNKMVRKLSDSAQALARSEREGAWREMARQVAHEIKNPLTPMKLSIQYLQRAIDNNAPNVKELSKQVADTLVEQIDQLSKIAGDFSQFANIANVHKEIFDLSAVLNPIIQLFRADPRIQLSWYKAEMPYLIEADKIQVNRLFTNLIKNAVESCPDPDMVQISITQEIADDTVVIAVQDNGSGIPEHMQAKIFTPNFTTKTSGTGLGLAICRGIVEKANGHIWFETKENKGTTFFVSLPLAKEGTAS